MNDSSALDRFLQTDPHDVGCDKAMEVLHIYVELEAAQPDVAADRYHGVASHLRACGPCSEDFEGLLAVVAHRVSATTRGNAAPLETPSEHEG